MFKSLSLVRLTFFILCLSCQNLVAQIKTSSPKTDSWIPKEKYDSLENKLGKNIHLYIGQKLFMPDCDYSIPRIMDHYKEYVDTLGYKRQPQKYRPGRYGSSYKDKKDIIGQYYEVLDTVSVPNKYLDKRDYYLQLLHLEFQDTVWYEYDYPSEHELRGVMSFPFITLGYYEKLRSRKIGKVFQVLNFQGESSWYVNSYPSGELKKIPRYTKVKCIDVVVADQSLDDSCGLSYIIEYKNQKFITPISIEGIRYK